MILQACYVACDTCHRPGPVTVDGAGEARDLARREEGFARVAGHDYCPDHKPEHAPTERTAP